MKRRTFRIVFENLENLESVLKMLANDPERLYVWFEDIWEVGDIYDTDDFMASAIERFGELSLDEQRNYYLEVTFAWREAEGSELPEICVIDNILFLEEQFNDGIAHEKVIESEEFLKMKTLDQLWK